MGAIIAQPAGHAGCLTLCSHLVGVAANRKRKGVRSLDLGGGATWPRAEVAERGEPETGKTRCSAASTPAALHPPRELT